MSKEKFARKTIVDWDRVRYEIETNLEFVDDILLKYFGDEDSDLQKIVFPEILRFCLKLSFEELRRQMKNEEVEK